MFMKMKKNRCVHAFVCVCVDSEKGEKNSRQSNIKL